MGEAGRSSLVSQPSTRKRTRQKSMGNGYAEGTRPAAECVLGDRRVVSSRHGPMNQPISPQDERYEACCILSPEREDGAIGAARLGRFAIAQ